MENLLIAVNAVVPFIIYLSIGYIARITKLVREPFLKELNTAAFKLFFPVMMFNNFYKMDLSGGLNGRFAFFVLAAFMIQFVLLILTVPRLVKSNPRRGVVIQGLFRSNCLIFALPLCASVFGDEGTALASLVVSLMVPIYNMLAVIVFEVLRGGKIHPLDLIKKVITNPLVLGAIAGLIFILLKIKLPASVEKPVGAIADMTSPISLIVLGGTLHFDALGRNKGVIAATLTVKMILMPAVLLAFAVLFGLNAPERFVAFTTFATPIAVSSYAMAENMGGDGELAGQLVVVSTVVSIVTIFLWIVILKNLAVI